MFDFFPRLAVERPVLTSMMVIMALVLGIFGFTRLPTDLFPEVEFPVVSVSTIYPGAGPEEIETQVTDHIEEAVANLADIDELSSFSQENVSIVIVQFDLGVDPDQAAIDVRDRIEAVRDLLPDETEAPTVQKFDLGSIPIMELAFYGPQGTDVLYEYADEELSERFSRVGERRAVQPPAGRGADHGRALPLPALLAGHRDRRGGHARHHHRDVPAHGPRRVHAERHDADGAQHHRGDPGHQHHRGAGEHLPAPGPRRGAPLGRADGYDGDRRRRGRVDADQPGCLHAHRVHGRHHRAVLQGVRPHGRVRHHLLHLHLLHAGPADGREAAAGQRDRAGGDRGAAGAALEEVGRRLPRPRAGLPGRAVLVPRPGAQRLDRHRLHRGALRLTLVVAGGFVGGEFMPAGDEGGMQIELELPSGTPIQRTAQVAAEAEERLRSRPEVESTLTTIAGGGFMGIGGGANIATLTVTLLEDAPATEEVLREVRPLLADLPDVAISAVPIDPSSVGGGAGAPIQLEISGPDYELLRQLAEQVTAELALVPELSDVTNTLEEPRTELIFRPDRAALADYGLTAGQVGEVVRGSFEGAVAGVFRGEVGRERDIRVRVTEEARQRASQLGDVQVRTPGGSVPISALGEVVVASSPTAIQRVDRVRTVVVEAQIGQGTLTDATGAIQRRMQEAPLPPGYQWEVGGEFEQFSDAIASVLVALVLAIIMLVGIVVNNAILILDYVGQLRQQGWGMVEALMEAAPARLRAIVMSNVAIVFALIPQALSTGSGASFRVPMAVVTIGGVLLSAVFTLFLIP